MARRMTESHLAKPVFLVLFLLIVVAVSLQPLEAVFHGAPGRAS